MSAGALSIRGLHAGYDGREVLHGVDVEVARGEWLALLGPNGSGKSTLLGCAAGCHVPHDGDIRIGGFSLDTEPIRARQRLGFALATENLPELLTGRQCLQVHAAAKQLDGLPADLLGLAAELRLDALLDEPVGVYSFGTRQKLAVLLALVGEPELIMLDEAFNGLDMASTIVLKRDLRSRVRSGRCAIVFATHALDIVERCADRVLLLHEGHLVGGWSNNALNELRASGIDALEAALAMAIRSAEDSGSEIA